MEESITLNMGDESIRFTPGGKIFINDAIKMMCPGDEYHAIWEKIKKNHVEILSLCEKHRTGNGEDVTIVGKKGWDKIVDFLTEYMFKDQG